MQPIHAVMTYLWMLAQTTAAATEATAPEKSDGVVCGAIDLEVDLSTDLAGKPLDIITGVIAEHLGIHVGSVHCQLPFVRKLSGASRLLNEDVRVKYEITVPAGKDTLEIEQKMKNWSPTALAQSINEAFKNQHMNLEVYVQSTPAAEIKSSGVCEPGSTDGAPAPVVAPAPAEINPSGVGEPGATDVAPAPAGAPAPAVAPASAIAPASGSMPGETSAAESLALEKLLNKFALFKEPASAGVPIGAQVSAACAAALLVGAVFLAARQYQQQGQAGSLASAGEIIE